MRSFGNELNRLALVVSSIDESKWTEIKEILKNYFIQNLGAEYFNLMVDGIRVANEPGLRTIWSSDGRDHSDPLFRDGEYFGLRSLAYQKGQFLWIVAEDEGLVGRDKVTLKDLWNGQEDLPCYNKTHDNPTRTVLISPLRFGRKYFGVLSIEHPDYKTISPEAKEEVRAFSEALARIVWVWQTTSEQLTTLQRALTEFRHSVDSMRPALEKPRIFLAYPKEAEEDVLTSIEKVLGEFEDRIDNKSWETMSETGNITEQVVKEISMSQLGICYVSEKSYQNSAKKRRKYVDNKNVLFEAGMLQALRANKDSPGRGWIPIREHERFAGAPCFDIAAERTVIVTRDEEGKMDTRQFRDDLRKILQTALDGA